MPTHSPRRGSGLPKGRYHISAPKTVWTRGQRRDGEDGWSNSAAGELGIAFRGDAPKGMVPQLLLRAFAEGRAPHLLVIDAVRRYLADPTPPSGPAGDDAPASEDEGSK